MKLKTTLLGKTYTFRDLKEVLAKANEEKTGDKLAGLAAENALLPLPEPGLPVLPVLLKPLEGPAHDLPIVCHGPLPPVSVQVLHVFPQLVSGRPGGLLLPPGGGPVSGLDLLRRM